MNIAGFSFLATRSKNILYKIRSIDSCYLISSTSINHYLTMLDYERPDMLVGLGDYSGVDRNKIRIESFCTNVLRNETIDGLPKQEFDCFVPKEYDTAVFGIGHGMGNSRCNRWCYELTRHTMQQGYSTKLLFFHIPSAYPFTKAYTKIDILVTHIKEKDF